MMTDEEILEALIGADPETEKEILYKLTNVNPILAWFIEGWMVATEGWNGEHPGIAGQGFSLYRAYTESFND